MKCLRAEVEEHSKGCQHSSILDDAISAFLSSTNPQKKELNYSTLLCKMGEAVMPLCRLSLSSMLPMSHVI